MKIAVSQTAESRKEVHLQEETIELNRTCAREPRPDFRFLSPLEVDLNYYRSGRDVFFHGMLTGSVEGCCGRCLQRYPVTVKKGFDFVLTPEVPPAKSRELNRDELGLSFYSSDEIDLSPYIWEQAILALPIRPLCDSRCRGLCSGCGVNLNLESCRCASKTGDLRMAVFRNLRLKH